MKRGIRLIFFIISIYCCVFTSCTAVMTKAIGMKSMKTKSTKQIKKFSEKFNIPNEQSYIIDTASFCNNIDLLDSSQKYVSKDLMQPLQVRAYSKNSNKQLSFFTANCYANGFPNFNWNSNQSFNGNLLNDSLRMNGKFIRLISDVRDFQIKNPNITFNLKDDLFNLRPLYNNTTDIYNDNAQYIVVVYWTIFMNRQSKRLINLLQDFQKRSSENIKLYYVNIDNLYHVPCLKVG